MPNHFLNRVAEQGTTGHGRKSETRVLKSMGARAMPASGAMRGAKSDGILKLSASEFRLELKATSSDTMKLDVGWLAKISNEARRNGQTPALVISFVNGDGKPMMKSDAEWVCIPKSAFESMIV